MHVNVVTIDFLCLKYFAAFCIYFLSAKTNITNHFQKIRSSYSVQFALIKTKNIIQTEKRSQCFCKEYIYPGKTNQFSCASLFASCQKLHLAVPFCVRCQDPVFCELLEPGVLCEVLGPGVLCEVLGPGVLNKCEYHRKS